MHGLTASAAKLTNSTQIDLTYPVIIPRSNSSTTQFMFNPKNLNLLKNGLESSNTGLGAGIRAGFVNLSLFKISRTFARFGNENDDPASTNCENHMNSFNSFRFNKIKQETSKTNHSQVIKMLNYRYAQSDQQEN